MCDFYFWSSCNRKSIEMRHSWIAQEMEYQFLFLSFLFFHPLRPHVETVKKWTSSPNTKGWHPAGNFETYSLTRVCVFVCNAFDGRDLMSSSYLMRLWHIHMLCILGPNRRAPNTAHHFRKQIAHSNVWRQLTTWLHTAFCEHVCNKQKKNCAELDC